MKHRLYRLQQHLAITNAQSTVILAAAVLLFGGLVVQQVRPSADLPPEIYAEADSLFAAGTAGLEAASLLPEPAPASTAPSAAPGLIDLNAASKSELQQLPRIGPALAERIVAYRTRRGGFRRVDDLLDVRGIGPKTLDRLIPHVTASTSTAHPAPQEDHAP